MTEEEMAGVVDRVWARIPNQSDLRYPAIFGVVKIGKFGPLTTKQRSHVVVYGGTVHLDTIDDCLDD
jgi:hypothetical protein